MIAIVKKDFQVQYKNIYYCFLSGEHREYDYFKSIIANHILENYIKNGTLTLFDKQTELESSSVSKQDKDGNEIAVDTQLTAKELKDKLVKGQKTKLLKEEKLIEIKIVK